MLRLIMSLVDLVILLTLGYSYYFMKQVNERTVTDGKLTRSEKLTVWVTILFGTILSGLIYINGWKEKLPTKANQVKIYIKNIIFGLVGLGVTGILLGAILVALK